ncbi:hypothetical protein PG995_011675 [Apiospora arundinis]
MARLATRDERFAEATSDLLDIAHINYKSRQRREPYLALEDPDSIRLVVINPGEWTSPISCHLIYRRLDSPPDYAALSYAWGSPRATRPILVDGVKFQVTVNLESALRHLRRESDSLTIWIDAIAINQEDLDERSQQVNLMRRIYHEAFKVIVWLGDGVRHRITDSSHYGKPPTRVTFYGDDGDHEKIATFIDKWSVSRRSAKYTALDVYCLIRMFVMQEQEQYSLRRLHPSHLLGLAEALRIMTMSQWWTRMWVFQEVVVAKSVVYQYSGVEAPLEMFTEAASCLQNYGYPMSLQSDVANVLHHYSKTLSDIERWRYFRGKHPSRRCLDNTSDLLGLLRATSSRKASDDRDRVFALLGLLDLKEHLLVPDYQKTTAEVFMSVCWANIKETKTLDVLCGDLGRKNRSDLPSWTADWSAIVSDSDEVRLKLLEKYNACGPAKANPIQNWEELRIAMESSSVDIGLSFEVPPWVAHVFMALASRKSPEADSSTNGSMIDYRAVSAMCRYVDLDPSCTHQAMNSLYEHPKGKRLCGPATLVGEVYDVKEAVHEPIDLDSIRQAIKCANIQPGGDPDLRSVVFDMKYVNGQFCRLQQDDLEALSRWGKERLGQDRTEGRSTDGHSASSMLFTDDLGFDVVFKTLAVRRKMFFATNYVSAPGKMFSTKYVAGWGPLDTRRGDKVYCLPGGRTPFVCRGEIDQSGIEVLRLVGDCYLGRLMDGEGVSTANLRPTCQLQHAVLPTIFWDYCKYDLVAYFNESLVESLVEAGREAELRGRNPLWFEKAREMRPKLLYIDKVGVYDTWVGEVHKWADAYEQWDFLPVFLRTWNSALGMAFRNIERMPKPPGHIIVA